MYPRLNLSQLASMGGYARFNQMPRYRCRWMLVSSFRWIRRGGNLWNIKVIILSNHRTPSVFKFLKPGVYSFIITIMYNWECLNNELKNHSLPFAKRFTHTRAKLVLDQGLTWILNAKHGRQIAIRSQAIHVVYAADPVIRWRRGRSFCQ